MTESRESERRYSNTLMVVAQLMAFFVALAIVASVELPRMGALAASDDKLADWIAGFNIDTTFYLVLLLLAPVVWRIRRAPGVRPRASWKKTVREWLSDSPSSSDDAPPYEFRTKNLRLCVAWCLAGIVALTSFGVSVGISVYQVDDQRQLRFGDLPPAYHDEYSYLFQAKTFLAGRMSFPSHATMPELFDQMHVLNEGRFASRYFPGVGAWIAVFQAFGKPYLGHWLAGTFTAMLVFWTGRELANNGVGLLAGMLTALSPGMGLFSNLLLSHHPALVGLSLFLFAFVRMQRTSSKRDAILAGVGLTFAMLCRPMTAAGFGLPFGIWFAWFVFRGGTQRRDQSPQARSALIAGLAIPLVIGFLVLFIHNKAITGNGVTTPYQLYTDIYTPRHVYGFNNVERGEKHLGPKVIEKYDTWAENLTPPRAVTNVKHRVIASLQWTLGIIPLTMATIVILIGGTRLGGRWWLILAAILSLHAAHIPYWYAGIMEWHYVFETGPLLCLAFAASTWILFTNWTEQRRSLMRIWWAACVVASMLVTFTNIDPLWLRSRLANAILETSFSRLKYHDFHELIENQVTERPALVLVQHDPSDIHIDYVTNDPGLDSEIIFGRIDSDKLFTVDQPRDRDIAVKVNRKVYVFRANEWRLYLVRFYPPLEFF